MKSIYSNIVKLNKIRVLTEMLGTAVGASQEEEGEDKGR